MNHITFDKLIAQDDPGEFLKSAEPFQRLIMQYRCALLEVKTKFEVLNQELSVDAECNPILSISSRIKKTRSMIQKMKKKNMEITLENLEKGIRDIAGIRVICYFPEDIYVIADRICSQDDITLVEKKDYIRYPKENGYRSLHLILEVPVFFMNEKKEMKVEVQMRTIAMDMWAGIEHRIRYKKAPGDGTESIAEDLKRSAEELHRIDLQMQQINTKARIKKENSRRC